MAQKLSPTARRAKAARDKRYAMSEWGKYKKRTAQAKKCPRDTTMTTEQVNVLNLLKIVLVERTVPKTKQQEGVTAFKTNS